MASPSSASSTNSENKFGLTIEVPKRGNGLRDGVIEQPKKFFREHLFNMPINIVIPHINPFNGKAELNSI